MNVCSCFQCLADKIFCVLNGRREHLTSCHVCRNGGRQCAAGAVVVACGNSLAGKGGFSHLGDQYVRGKSFAVAALYEDLPCPVSLDKAARGQDGVSFAAECVQFV